MYRILIADDEGLMLEALKKIILDQYKDCCELATAKTGRAAIETAESFHPDIIFLDIQMPGINGIQAMKEIRESNGNALFYIISAYDKFDYAQEAIDLGVEKYLTKPITRKTVLSVVAEAMEKIDRTRTLRTKQLQIQEKLEIIVPVVEQSLITNLLFQTELQDVRYYLQLLDIGEENGYIMVIQFGADYQDGQLVSPLRTNVQAQDFYPEFHDLVKDSLNCVVGPLMSNRVVLLIPRQEETISYEDRIRIVENARLLAAKLEEHFSVKSRIGIGRVCKMEDLQLSYREAVGALNDSKSHVIHIDDLKPNGYYEEEFPAEIERRIFRLVEAGNTSAMLAELNDFFDWMIHHYPEDSGDICLKVLEYIIRAERAAFDSGTINYKFSDRKDYLRTAQSLLVPRSNPESGTDSAATDFEPLRRWFIEKMTAACDSIRTYRESQSNSVVKKAQAYIQENYSHDLSLDDVSRAVNISPYYFSKIFKEESGENFIEYLTRIRVEKAKELLEKPDLSVKIISSMCGYSDPNYFSRLFKKQTDMTPREYRMKFSGQ
ncbi:MAG: response regulator [Lachnospiraceae bacterium]|nr:response regulator [Lachnospiraceae bacterium]